MVQILPHGMNTDRDYIIWHLCCNASCLQCSTRINRRSRWSIVGPLLLIAITEDIKDTIDVYALVHDLYTDDTQLLSHTCLAEIQRRHVIENCVIAIKDLCASRRLQLNPDKLKLCDVANMAKLRKEDISLRLWSVVINPSETVHNTGPGADHVSASMCFYHLRWLRQLRWLVDQPIMHRLVSAFIIARLD